MKYIEDICLLLEYQITTSKQKNKIVIGLKKFVSETNFSKFGLL